MVATILASRGTVRLVGSPCGHVFSSVAGLLQWDEEGVPWMAVISGRGRGVLKDGPVEHQKSKVDRSRDDTLDRRRWDELSEPMSNFSLISLPVLRIEQTPD